MIRKGWTKLKQMTMLRTIELMVRSGRVTQNQAERAKKNFAETSA
jgi:hypothetical protein